MNLYLRKHFETHSSYLVKDLFAITCGIISPLVKVYFHVIEEIRGRSCDKSYVITLCLLFIKFMKYLGYVLGLNIDLQKFNIRKTNMYLI